MLQVCEASVSGVPKTHRERYVRIVRRMRLLAALVLVCTIEAQDPSVKTATLSITVNNNGKPMPVPFQCTDDDMQWAGMSCTEEQPCPVYLELSAMETVGNRIILAGNIHTESVTLYSVLLGSEDGGATWQEPYERMRGTGLDHVQFIDFQNGWISGETLVPVSRDPFLLITSDGGKSWRLRSVFGEGGDGAIQQFRFETATNGSLVIDRGQSADSSRYELYETPNGGDTWMIRRTSEGPIALEGRLPDSAEAGARIRADARSKSFAIEKRQGEHWNPMARFLVEIGSCKPVTPAVPEPSAEQEPAAPAVPATPPSLKRHPPKP
jgi:hypothetical protein